MERIDSLIGKYSRLKVNKVVAVSSTGFSGEVKRKATAHDIEVLTTAEAERVDWAARLGHEFFDVMTHRNMLMRVGAFSEDGAELAYTEIDENETVSHKSPLFQRLCSRYSILISLQT